VRYLGLSECGVDTLQRAVAVHQINAYQIEYSPFSMDIEKPEVGLLDACRELGIATVAYSPLGRGMLTGQYTKVSDFAEGDFRRSIPRFSTQENLDKNLELVKLLQTMGKKKNATSGQLTLAWMMKQGADIFPIPGTKKLKYLEENVGACYIELSDEEDKIIREAIEKAEVVGTRVAQHLMGDLIVDTPPLHP
jgi:aryl-alcohol dehydrogenase-like predicted oxidoreductase